MNVISLKNEYPIIIKQYISYCPNISDIFDVLIPEIYNDIFPGKSYGMILKEDMKFRLRGGKMGVTVERYPFVGRIFRGTCNNLGLCKSPETQQTSLWFGNYLYLYKKLVTSTVTRDF